MKRIFLLTRTGMALILLFSLGLTMAKNKSETTLKKDSHKLKALVFLGGKNYDQQAFLEIFKDLPDVKFTPAIHPNANQWFESDSIDEFDVLVFYDMVQEISEDQKKAMIELFRKGKGAVFLHHSICNYQSWEEYEKIVGGRFYLDIDENPHKDSLVSTYRHDVQIPVEMVDPNHPITKGLEDFTILDETYGNFKVLPEVEPLLTTNHPENGPVMAWTNEYGKSKIVYLQLGDNPEAYKNENYRRLIKQAVQWTVSFPK